MATEDRSTRSTRSCSGGRSSTARRRCVGCTSPRLTLNGDSAVAHLRARLSAASMPSAMRLRTRSSSSTAFAPFEYLSVIVAQELRAGGPDDRKSLERHLLNVYERANACYAVRRRVAQIWRSACRDGAQRGWKSPASRKRSATMCCWRCPVANPDACSSPRTNGTGGFAGSCSSISRGLAGSSFANAGAIFNRHFGVRGVRRQGDCETLFGER